MAQPPEKLEVKVPEMTDVRVTSLPDRAHVILRDGKGTPTGSLETDA